MNMTDTDDEGGEERMGSLMELREKGRRRGF
jgi:hypothetical protein